MSGSCSAMSHSPVPSELISEVAISKQAEILWQCSMQTEQLPIQLDWWQQVLHEARVCEIGHGSRQIITTSIQYLLIKFYGFIFDGKFPSIAV